jgi:hypothetical protein
MRLVLRGVAGTYAGVEVRVLVGVLVEVDVGVCVGVHVAVRVGVCVDVGVLNGASVAVCVGETAGVEICVRQPKSRLIAHFIELYDLSGLSSRRAPPANSSSETRPAVNSRRGRSPMPSLSCRRVTSRAAASEVRCASQTAILIRV